MFDVMPDYDLRMLRVTLRGFWDKAVMDDYMREVRRQMRDLRQRVGCEYVLINMIDFAIQSKHIAEGHAENLRGLKEASGTRVALVMQGALSKLQAARVATDTGHETFADEPAAVEWLLSGRG